MTLKKDNSKVSKNIKKKKEDLLKALDISMGNVSHATKKAMISRNQFYIYRRDDKDFDEKCYEIEESLKDHAESMLRKNINDGKETSIIFYLKTKAKDRGYIEKTEIDIVDKTVSETTLFTVKPKELNNHLGSKLKRK